MKTENWTRSGSNGELIHGTMHEAQGYCRGIVLMAHGFKGYKDYGMFPWLANQFANLGYQVHRFNFSHSGMDEGDQDFKRLDLFEKSTWNRQVEDLACLARDFAVEDFPLFLFGHSRGGVSSLLAAGRGVVKASGIITLSSPSECLSMDQDTQEMLLKEGRMPSPSGRTGQMMYVGKVFLEEQMELPDCHDLEKIASLIDIPCLLIHGVDDPTVPKEAAVKLHNIISTSTLELIQGANHVFNTPNPFYVGDKPSCQLVNAWKAIESWLELKQ